MTPETSITEHAAALLDECGWQITKARDLAVRNFYIRTSHFPPATGTPHGQPRENLFDQALKQLLELYVEMRRIHDEHEAKMEFRRRYLDPMKAS